MLEAPQQGDFVGEDQEGPEGTEVAAPESVVEQGGDQHQHPAPQPPGEAVLHEVE